MVLGATVKLNKKKLSMTAMAIVNRRRTTSMRVSDRGFVNGEKEQKK